MLLPAAGNVSISIFDNQGIRVISFAKDLAALDLDALGGTGDGRLVLPVGWHLPASNGVAVPAGVYLWEVQVQTADGQKLQSVHKLGGQKGDLCRGWCLARICVELRAPTPCRHS